MKSFTLIALMLAATMAQAKTYQVTCQVPSAQTVSVTFTGSGTVTVEDSGDTTAVMSLSLQGPGVQDSFQEMFTGATQMIPAGDLMLSESYDVELVAEHKTSEEGKPMALKMLLGGPKNQASSRVIIGNDEYHSNCDIVP